MSFEKASCLIFLGVILSAGFAFAQPSLPMTMGGGEGGSSSGVLVAPLSFSSPGNPTTSGLGSFALNSTNGGISYIVSGLPSGATPLFAGIYSRNPSEASQGPIAVLFNGTSDTPSTDVTYTNVTSDERTIAGQVMSTPQTTQGILSNPNNYLLGVVTINGTQQSTSFAPLSGDLNSTLGLPSTLTLNPDQEMSILTSVFGMSGSNPLTTSPPSPSIALPPGFGRQSVTPLSTYSPSSPSSPIVLPNIRSPSPPPPTPVSGNSEILGLLNTLLGGSSSTPNTNSPNSTPISTPTTSSEENIISSLTSYLGFGAPPPPPPSLIPGFPFSLGGTPTTSAGGSTVSTSSLLQVLITSLASGGQTGTNGGTMDPSTLTALAGLIAGSG